VSRRILIIDDDEGLTGVLRKSLIVEGYEVELACTGASGLVKVVDRPPDLVILDLILPDVDGFDLCRDLAGRAVAPIIILSARSQEVDKIRALNLGADDYMTKPFSFGELLARIRVVLRRVDPERLPTGTVRFANVLVNFDKMLVERGGVRVPFTQKEMDLLRFLLRHPRRLHTGRVIAYGVGLQGGAAHPNRRFARGAPAVQARSRSTRPATHPDCSRQWVCIHTVIPRNNFSQLGRCIASVNDPISNRSKWTGRRCVD